jgi:hypothetical protein
MFILGHHTVFESRWQGNLRIISLMPEVLRAKHAAQNSSVNMPIFRLNYAKRRPLTSERPKRMA